MAGRDGFWCRRAEQRIAEAHARLPADVSFAERKVALRAAYPFGARSHYPYKVWLRCQRAYLARYDPAPLTPENAPLFFKRRAR